MAEPLPDEDTAPPVDPFEGELVAYLDGELEPAAARRVEARLAVDPQARARAASLKKTFELLDYLPKPEPSATFATRTLDKLPALQPGSQQPQSQGSPATAQSQPKPARISQSGAARATTRVIPQAERPQAPLLLPHEPRQPRRMVWAAGILIAVAGFATAGYFGGAAIRSHQSGSRSIANKDTQEELTLSDRRLVENLPLYTVVDDYAFVNDLAKPEYFGDDPTVSYDQALKVPSIQPEMPASTAIVTLEKAFKLLSQERQQAIRELDKHLYAEPPAIRDRLLHVLEAYVAWLNLLSETERRGVLAAATPELRLKQIRDIRDRQWFEMLPPNQRSQLVGVNDSLKRKLTEEWKAEDSRRRKEWAYARKHPSEILDANKTPWPFDTDKGRNDVLAFAKIARLDDTKGSRLTANELDRYAAALSFSQSQGGAAWNSYGKTLYEFAKKYEEFLLPPPDPKVRYADFSELPLPYQKYLPRLKSKSTLVAQAGKWPEFALEVHKDVPQLHKEFSPKGDIKALPPLGPIKATEFTAPIRTFVEGELSNKLTEDDRKSLRREEGKWPEYPRELIRLARLHDLSMPGVMLPGSPKQWDALYGQTRNKQ